ncbi:MAG: winged helix-turn-helix transcriptional regulator [Chloroflexi bacterium]|nr:winged helix-turn-helix transcriptional regulator [Chloroflexota bacterium]
MLPSYTTPATWLLFLPGALLLFGLSLFLFSERFGGKPASKALNSSHIISGRCETVDKNDVILCQLLLANSRLSYRELAEKLDLSVTAVHNRIQSLIDMGIIRKFTAGLSIFAQNAIHVFIYGNSKTSSITNLKPKLEKQGSIYWLAVGGGNVLYVGAYLRSISKLEALVRFVKETAEMPEPTVGLTGSPIPPLLKNVKIAVDNKLCDLDYKIIRSLRDDSRKATSVIAEEIGVSTKTVRRRLTRMINNYLIQFSIEWYPDASNDIMSIFHVTLKADANPNTPNRILQEHYPNTIFYWSLANIPSVYVFMVWTPTTKELKDIRESLEQEVAVQSVAPNIIYTGYIFPTWRDQTP